MRKKSLFNQICGFINSKQVSESYDIVDILRELDGSQVKDLKTRVDYYQRLLERSGYLKLSNEKIKVLQKIPAELTTSDINMAWRFKEKQDMAEPVKIAQSHRISEKESLFFEGSKPTQQKIDLAINLGVIDSAKSVLTQFRSTDAFSRARVYNVVSILENISRELKEKI
jgi:hypothetical protein